MKIKNLFMAVLALLAFNACTFIPEPPYKFPTNGGSGDTETEEGVYINETFKTEFGVFTTVVTVGDTPWVIDYSTAKMTSYVDTNGDNKGDTNKEATSWLISAPVDFTDETEAYVTFDYIIRYSESGKVANNHQLLVSSNYSGDAAAATWTDIPYNAVEGADWETFAKANVAVPAEFMGKSSIVFALRYTAKSKAGTWEVKNFKVKHGKPEEGETVKPEVTPEEPETPSDAIIYETFAESLGTFTTVQTAGNYPWVNDFSTAKATSYENSTNNAAVSWLVSPAVDLTGVTEAYIAFEYIIQYADNSKIAENHRLYICNDFDGDAATATWVNIPFGATPGGKLTDGKPDWKTFSKANVAVPAEFLGKTNVTFALCYTGTETKASTWEVKNFTVAPGAADTTTPEEPEQPETPETPVVPTGENLLANSSFETWSGNVASGWNGPVFYAGAHNATIEQSTDARTGNYSIIVNGDAADNNKRLVSQSYKLKAGTYTYSVYVKANDADKGICRIGYIDSSKNYTYETAAASAVTDEWTAHTQEFTLTADTEVAFIVMNNKSGNGASFLVDDAQLVTTDGGIVDDTTDGGNEGEEEPETPDATTSFTAVTSITSGKYVIAAGTNMAIALDASMQYGYLPVTTVSPESGVIKTTEDNAYTIEAVEGGYSIKDALGRYLYIKETYNSVNLSTSLPAEGGVWTIEFNADGTATIKNVYSGKTMQYSSQYTSYGIYPDVRGEMPTLYKMN